MVTKLGCVVLVVGLALSLPAAGYFSETELQATHPELFMPGRVGVVTNADTAYYVYSGGVRKSRLSDAPRLKTIATLRAENALAKYVRGERKADVIIRTALQVAKVVRGDEITYVFAVPVKCVSEVEKEDKTTARQESASNVVEQVSAPMSSSTEKSLLALVDEVERNPADVKLRVAVADAYFKAACYDEATRECCWVVDRLTASMAKDMSDAESDMLMRSAEMLFSLGEYRKAKVAFACVQERYSSRHHQRALQAISEIQLRLGVE